MADAANKKTSEKSEDSNDAPPIPPVRKNKLAKRSKSLLDEITEVLETRAKTVTMETDTTESDFSDFDHSLFTRRNLSSPPLRPNPDSAIPKTDIDSYYTNSPLISVTNHNPDQSNVQTPSHSLRPSSLHSARQSPSHSARQSPSHSTRQSSSHSSSWSPAHSQYSGKSPRSPARKQRQYIVNPDDSDTITRVTTTYYQNSRPNSADSYVTQNAYLTTDSSSYDSTTTDTESEIASPVRNSVYGLRYRKIHNDDTDNKSDEDILSDAESLEQLMLHRLPGENLGMILGVEAGKKGSSKVRKVIVKSVTLGGAAYRATGGTQGIRVGDEIVEVNRKVLSTLTHDECVSVFHEMPLRILLSVRRKNDPRRGSEQHSGLHQKLGPVHSWPSYNGYQSETSESEAEGGYPRGFQTHEIKIRKNSKENLGISIVPSYGSTREYYQIKRLLPSGVCARDPQLNIGDRLVSCNGQSLKGVTQNECLNILKSAGNDLKLTVLSSDNLAYLGMDSNTESEAESVNNNVYKNGLHSEPIQHSEHGLSASKTNANVLFAQKNVKLAYTPPYIANQIPSDSESSVASTPSKETQSVISEVDQHILDLTGLGMSQFNGMEPSETNFTSADNSLLESIPPPMEFSDNPISPEESETSTLTDPGDSSLPFTNLDDLLGNDSTATNTPIHTTSTPIHNVSSTISQSFPENDDLLTLTSSSEELTIVSTSENVVHSDASDRLSGTIPYTDLDNIQNVSDQNSPKSSNNILEFDTKVSNVIEGGQSTTLFDIGVKSVNDARHVSQTSNIDDLLFLDQTNNQQSSSNSSVEINKVVVSQEQNVSPQVNVLNTEQTNEKTSNSLDNVTTVQVGLISLNPNDVVDEGLVTKVPIIDLEDTKQDSQLENQVTQVAVNEKPRVTKVDVGYDKSNASFRNENDVKIPGATVFCVDNDIKDSNTARITVDNPSPPVPTPRLSPQVVPRKHRPKSEIIDLSEKQAVPSSPTPLPRKTHAHNAERNAEQSPFHVLHEAPSLNTAKLVEAAKPSATIVVSNSDPDLLKSGSNIEKEVMNSVETITESKPTLIHDSVKDQGDASVSKLDMAPQKPQMSTITVKTPRQKSSKEARSDRSGKVMVTTCQTSDVRLSRPVEEEESIQPMSYVQDELGNRSCVPTPPTTPKRQQKTKDEGAKKEITDILMNLVNLESVSDNAVEHESTVIEEGKIEPEKVSRQTMETVLSAFSSLIPGLDKPQKKSIFQKAVSEVIDDMDDDNNNVPKEESKKTEISNKDEAEKSKCKKKEDFSEKSKSMNEMPSVLQTGFASISNAIQSKLKVSNTQNDISTENNTNEKIEPHAVKSADSTRGNISEDVAEKPKDIEIVSKNQEVKQMEKKQKQKEQKPQEVSQKSESIVPKPSLISAAPKKIAPVPHITTIRTQPFSSLKSGLTSFSTNKVSKADYPKRRCDDQPFQVDVLKGIAGLGIKLAVGNDGLAKVTNIQTSGPVAKTGQVRVGDYVLSINSTVLRGVSDSKVQQILRLLPRGLSKLVISTTIPHAHSPDKTGPLSIDTDCTDNSMELSPTSPSTGFTKYGVRVSPKPFSSLSNSSSPKSLSDGLASIKESKYSPVTPPTRKVSVDKTSDSVNGSSNGSASVEYPFGKDEPTSNGAKSVPFPFDKFEPSVNSVNKISGNQNGLADELVIKTDSSVGSSPIVSPRSPAGMSPALSPRSDSGDSGIEKAQKPVKKPVHSSNVYVNKNQNNPAKKLGIDIPKSHAESKIIAATWGKDTDEVSVKNPPPVAPKPKSRTAKAPVPDPPKKQVETQISVETAIQPQQSNNVESQPPIPSSRQKSPGVETLNLNDKLKRFESEIQRQTDLAKPSGPPPVAARRTSSSSEHSTASLRSSSPDRDVFLSDDKKSNGPTMVYSTTVKSKGDLPKDQDKSYYMKIKNQENSLEITRTEVRKQSVEEQVPKRKTSSGSSPLSPNSPFYQDLTEKPAKINPVRLNRALAPKGSSQNQNVEINSTVKLTAPSQPPPEIKPKPKTASWFAGKDSDTSTTKSECTSPTPSSVVSTEPHLIFESPKCKSPRNNGTKKSPSDSMTSPTSPRDQLVSPDATSFVPGVKLEYESPKSPLSPKQDMQRKFSEDEIQTKFDDLLNLDSVAEKTIVESTPEDKTLVVSVVHEEVTSEKIENVESAGLNVNNSALVDNTEEVKVDDVELKLDDSADDIQEDAVDNNDKLIESETPDSKQSTHLPTENIVEETPDSKQSTSLPAENVEDAHTIPVIPDSAVEPYAAALVEKVIDSAKECIMKSEGEKQSSTENSILEPVSEEKMDVVETTLIESSAPVEETLVPESVESVQIKPDILNDVQTNDVSKKEPEVVSESDSERSPSPPPLPSSPPPPLPSSPPPMTAVPPPTLLPSFEDPPDLVDFMTGSIVKPPTQFIDPQPDVVNSSPMVQEEDIRSEERKDVAAAPNLIGDIAPSVLPDVTNDSSAIDKNESSPSETGILDDSAGSSVDPVEDQLLAPQIDSLLNTACNSQHDNVTSESNPQQVNVVEQTNTTLVDTEPDSTIPNQVNSTDLNVVKDTKNDLLDSNENLFSAKPVVISSDEPDVPNSSSSIQVSSFQESLPITNQDNSYNKIYSSTPAKGLATPSLVATDIDIDSSFKSDTSNETLLDDTDNSEYVNISMTSNGPDVTNEALKVSGSSISKRDWTFVTSDKDTSVIEGKANVSFEFLDFTNVSLIEPEELKRLVDQANQTMDRTGVSSSDQIIVVLLHRKEPTDKVGLELMKGSQGKVIISGLTPTSLARTDGKIKVTDCLVSVNGKPVDDKSIGELQDLIETPCSTVVLVLSRGENSPKTPASPKPKEREVRKSSPITPTTPTSPTFTNLDFTCGETMEVTMIKGATGVGFCLAGGIGSPQGDMPIIIKRIFKGGPADKCGQLQVKDQILQVNDLDFTTMRHYEAWNHLKYLPDGEVKLVIRRGKEE